MTCLWFLLWMVGATWAQPTAVEGWEAVEQQVLPDLTARTVAADARSRVRAEFRAGAVSLEAAYPHLSAALLGDEALLRGRVRALAEADVKRSVEAQAPPPAARVDPRRFAVWKAALDACHTAEAKADTAERHLLSSVLAQLRAVPELSSTGVAPLLADLEALRDHPADLPEALEPERREEIEMQAAAAEVELGALAQWIRRLRVAAAQDRWPSSASDVSVLEGAGSSAAADRLGLLLRAHPSPDLEPVRRALEAYYTQRATDEDAAATQLRREIDAVTEPEAALPLLEADERLAVKRMEAAELRVSHADGSEAEQRAHVARLALRRAQADLAEARRKVKSGLAEAETAEATARLADQRAQAATAAAGGDEVATRIADLKTEYAAATERSAELRRKLEAAEELADAKLTSEIASQASAVRRLRGGLRFGEERPDPDALHRPVLGTLDDARERATSSLAHALEARKAEVETRRAVAGQRRRIEEGLRFRVELNEQQRSDLEEILQAWQRSLDSEQALAAEWVERAHALELSALQDVQRARVTKRDLAPYLSNIERNVDTNRFFEDLRKEADFLVPTVQFSVQERMLEFENPLLMLDSLQKVRALLAGFVWTIAAGLAWWWARGRSDGWALQFAKWVRRQRPEVRMSDVPALRDPTARAIRNVVDLLLGQVLLYSLGDALVEVQFLVRAYLYLAAYRAMLALFDFAVIPVGEVRPAALVLRADTFSLARRTVRWFLRYFVVAYLLRWVLWDVLQLDTLAGAVDTALSGLFWVIVVWSLFRWEPTFRETLSRRRGADNPFVRWLLPKRAGFLLRIPRAVLQLCLIVSLFLLDTLQRLAAEGSALGWVFNMLNRVSLREPDEVSFRPLEEEVRFAIMQGVTPEKHRIERAELSAVGTALAQWQETGLRGLVAVVGDRGMGKHTACHEVADILAGGGLDVRRARMPGPMRTSSDLFAWLASVVGCDGSAETHDELVEQLRSVEPRAVIIESAHRAFARRVGGLEMVQALFYLLNATSDHHFFVVTVHGPAWDYFAARGSMVDCGVFHTVVRLAPLSSQQMRNLTLARAGEAGVRVDFSVLERQTALGGEPGTEEERAVTIFYRLLADASNGSPTAGVEIFTRCLEATDDPHLARAHMAPALHIQPLSDLSDDALFILVAVDLHDELELEELGEVTNLPMAVVRASVRDLVSRGLLAREVARLSIPDHQCPAVQRTLRRRHFLHLGGDA